MPEKNDNKRELIDRLIDQYISDRLEGLNPNLDSLLGQYPYIADKIQRRIQCLDNAEQLFDMLIDPDQVSGYNLIGQKLGDFEILDLIGSGGMGKVFLARQLSLERQVALKVISNIGGGRDKTLERFRREANVLAKVSHPNIVPIYEVGEEGPYSYFAMEYVQGTSLDRILDAVRTSGRNLKASQIMQTCLEGQNRYDDKQPKRSDSAEIDTDYVIRISKLIAKIALALEYAHHKGILHRDVKPSNILIDVNGTPKLVDFGLARIESFQALTVSGELFGTPSYMSPEQVRQAGNMDCRSDVYSLGATYYECLTLHPPFEGDTINDTLTQVTSQEAVPPKKYCPRLSTDFNTVLLHALEKSPDDRYQTAQDFADDIINILEFRPISAKRPSISQRFYKSLRRNPLRITAVGILILAVLLLGLLYSNYVESRNRIEVNKWSSLAEYQHQNKEYNRALEYYKQALQSDKDSSELHYQIGRCYVAMGQYEKAQKALERAILIQPDYPSAYENLGAVYLALAQYQQAVETYKRLAQNTPTLPRALASTGVALAMMEPNEEALKFLKKAIEIDPNNLVAYGYIGTTYINLGRFDEAKAMAEDLIKIAPNNATGYVTLSKSLYGLNRFDEAIRVLQKAIRSFPDNASLRYNLGELYCNLERYSEALEPFHTAVQIEPEYFSAWAGLGACHYAMGEYEEAIQPLERSIELAPDIDLDRNLDLVLGHSLRECGKYQDAIKCYSRVIDVNSSNVYALAGLGLCSANQQHYDEAVTFLEKAIQAKPDYIEAYDQLIQVYDKLGLYNKAVEYQRKAIELAPDDETRQEYEERLRVYEANKPLSAESIGDIE